MPKDDLFSGKVILPPLAEGESQAWMFIAVDLFSGVCLTEDGESFDVDELLKRLRLARSKWEGSDKTGLAAFRAADSFEGFDPENGLFRFGGRVGAEADARGPDV